MSNHVTSIIIPFFNMWQLTHQALYSIYTHIPLSVDIEIILVDDASTELDCRSGAAWWQKDMSDKFPIKYVKNETNLGFGGSHNHGAEHSSGDILCFLSNDVKISGDFITPIEETIDRYNGEVLVGGRVLYTDTGWNALMINGQKSIVIYPEGWLLACTASMWKRIGGWDMDFGLFDYEDVSMGAWAIYNDVPMVGLNLSFLQHIGGATIYPLYPDRMERTNKNRKVFEEKWTKLLESKM